MEGAVKSAESIDVILERAPLDEQKKVDVFVESLSDLLNHLKSIVGTSWEPQMEKLSDRCACIVKQIGKQKTSFDPAGL